MRLIPVNPNNETHVKALYMLLQEREPWQSISHREMPTFTRHELFVADKVPHSLEEGEMRHRYSYAAWYLVTEMDSRIVGSIYLTRANEIGVFIFKADQGVKWGEAAVQMLMKEHGPRRYLANINPANEASRKMFEKLGFKTVQHTLALEAE